MEQDGGVRPQRLEASFDTKATSFGAYDRAFIDAVASRWYDLLDNMSYGGYRRGQVVVQFDLNYDGRITNLKVVENTVTGLLATLCEKAVSDPSPFEKWPREMRLTVGKDSREIKFTFHYNLCSRLNTARRVRPIKLNMETIVYILLILTSVVGLTFIVERGLALRWQKVVPPEIEAAVESCQTPEDVPRLRRVCEQHDAPLSRMTMETSS